MNHDPETPVEPTPDLTAAADADQPKPKRRRTAAKTESGSTDGVDAPAAKPRRRKAAAASDAGAPTEAADASDGPGLPDSAGVEQPEAVEAKVEAGQPASGEPAAEPGPKAPRRRSPRKSEAQAGPEVSLDGAAPAGLPEALGAPLAAGSGEGEAARRGELEEGGDEPSGPDAAPRSASEALADAQELLARVNQRFSDVVDGAYDVESEPVAGEVAVAAPAEPDKRVLRAQPDAPKLQKVLAQSGISSRRDIEQMIQDGRIAVNGQAAHVGQRVSFGDRIELDGKPVKVRVAPPPARVLAYHKPVGEVVTFNDPEGRPTVFRSLPRLAHGKWQSVGRLDINTEGLLLFSTSGELANQLMHPRFGVEREYAVRVLGRLEPEQRAQLLAGVNIDGYDSCFRSIDDGGGEGVNHWYRVVIAEGRYREVRRLFEAVGLTVSRLIRIRYGNVVLPRGLRRGVWVELDDQEVRAIRRLAQSERQAGQGNAQAGGGAPSPQRNRPGKGQPQPQGKGPRGPHERARGPGQGARPSPPPPASRHDDEDDERQPGDPTYIPNPLEQTFDRRFAKGSQRIVSGFGRPSDRPPGGPQRDKKGAPKQPDPMQTSIGYIGADAFFRKSGGGNKRRGGGGGGGGGRGGFGR